jgi:hypothetical protein
MTPRPAEPSCPAALAEPSTTTPRPAELSHLAEPSKPSRPSGDYARNIFAFSFALGATFSFVTWFYCNVLFVALQDTKQVIIKLQLKQF